MDASVEVRAAATLEKRSRRKFGAAEKQRLLAEFEALGHGDKGAWLRRQGLYAAQVSAWRRELREHGAQGLEAKPSGRKPADPRDARIDALQRENAKLVKRLRVSEALVELQKKIQAMLQDSDESENAS